MQSHGNLSGINFLWAYVLDYNVAQQYALKSAPDPAGSAVILPFAVTPTDPNHYEIVFNVARLSNIDLTQVFSQVPLSLRLQIVGLMASFEAIQSSTELYSAFTSLVPVNYKYTFADVGEIGTPLYFKLTPVYQPAKIEASYMFSTQNLRVVVHEADSNTVYGALPDLPAGYTFVAGAPVDKVLASNVKVQLDIITPDLVPKSAK
eukprot:Phypoly_transcript_08461.p1 GENE.Phypoly_transcript_08461~~Phypoly_transcript_08461.p1  ORF type:complete len:205 (+),score=27.66 Phypoly_transcript_08461:895-1509(+)